MASRDYYDENEERPAGHHRRAPDEEYGHESENRAGRDRYENDGSGRAQYGERDEFNDRRRPGEGEGRMNEHGSNRREGDYASESRGGGYGRRDDADDRRQEGYQRRDEGYGRQDDGSRREGESYSRRDENSRREGEDFGRGSGGYGRDDDEPRQGQHHGGQRRNEDIYGEQRPEGRFDEGGGRYDGRNPNESRPSDNYPPRNEYGSAGYGRDGREDGPQGGSYGNDRPSGGYGGGDSYGQGGGSQGTGRYGGQHGGSSSDGELFSNTLESLPGHRQRLQNEPLDEGQAVSAHQQMYGGGGYGSNQAATSDSMGSAAAMQALKMFTGGQGSQPQGGNAQESFIRMAMGEAAQLFDQQSAQGNAHPSASRQDAVSSAAQMALKMFMKSQGDGGSGGSGLMGLASKFL